VALAAGCALALTAGCGSEEQSAPEATVEAFVEALRESDAGAACEQLDTRTLDDLEVSGGCEEVLGAGLELFADEDVEIPDYEIGEVSVDGDTAEATLTAEATDDVIKLVQEDGEWKLDGATALAGLHPDSPLELETGADPGGG